MRRSPAALLLLFISQLATEVVSPGVCEPITFIDERTLDCGVVEVSEEGVLLRMPSGEEVFFEYRLLETETVRRLRGGLGPGVLRPVSPMAALIPGFEFRIPGEEPKEGIVISETEREIVVRIRHERRDRTLSRDVVEVLEREVLIRRDELFTKREIYEQEIRARPPRTEDEHLRWASQCASWELWDRVINHTMAAQTATGEEDFRKKLVQMLLGLMREVDDERAQELLWRASEAVIDHRIADAARLIGSLGEFSDVELASDAKRIIGLLEELKSTRFEELTRLCWVGLVDGSLWAKALDRSVKYEDARRYILESLECEVAMGVASRMRITEEKARDIWSNRRGGPASFAYNGASWLVDSPARRDVQAWWFEASTATRFSALKGLYIERKMKVMAVEHKDCQVCAGRGTPQGGEGRSGLNQCWNCLGLGKVRVVIYR